MTAKLHILKPSEILISFFQSGKANYNGLSKTHCQNKSEIRKINAVITRFLKWTLKNLTLFLLV